jgi:hypothetical protein
VSVTLPPLLLCPCASEQSLDTMDYLGPMDFEIHKFSRQRRQ